MAQSEVDSVDCVTSDRDGDIGNQSDDSSNSSLFKTQCVPSPTRKQRIPTVKCVPSLASVETDSSSDSSLEPRPLTLKAVFERFKKKKRKKRKKRKYKPKLRRQGRPSGTRNIRRSQIDAKQIKDKGAVFPFLESESGRKTLPWKKILTYEQAVARGFFHHIEKLKYEHHLKECLSQMHAGEDLEKEDFDSRRHKYMDDDGPLSPIEEPSTEDEATDPQSECDIKLVEDSCFIISTEFPRKRNLEQEKIKKESAFSKKSKAKDATQRGHRRSWKGGEHLLDKGRLTGAKNKSFFATQTSLFSMSFDTYKKEYKHNGVTDEAVSSNVLCDLSYKGMDMKDSTEMLGVTRETYLKMAKNLEVANDCWKRQIKEGYFQSAWMDSKEIKPTT